MTEDEFLVKILLHSFRQGQLAAFHILAQNISGRDERKAAIDAMFDEFIPENRRNAWGMCSTASLGR